MLFAFLPILALVALCPAALAKNAAEKSYNFTLSEGTQCGTMTVTWDGGKAPFELVLIPWNVQWSTMLKRITIPSSAEESRSYDFPVWPWEGGQTYVATMQDASGWGSGGVSEIKKIRPAIGSSCARGPENNPNDGAFWMEPESSLTPCQQMQFAPTEDVDLPANVVGIIPEGDTWEIPMTNGTARTLTKPWFANIKSGSPVVFAVLTSGKYGDLGFSGALTVKESSQSGCFSKGTLKVTVEVTLPTATGTPGNNESDTEAASHRREGLSTGAIVGIAIGSFAAAIIMFALLAWWLLRRVRAVRSNYAVDLHDNSSEIMGANELQHVVSPYHSVNSIQKPYVAAANRSSGVPSAHLIPTDDVPLLTSSEGYSTSQLSARGEPSSEASPSAQTSPSASLMEEVDADAPARLAGDAAPPSYNHVLWVTGGARRRPATGDKSPAPS